MHVQFHILCVIEPFDPLSFGSRTILIRALFAKTFIEFTSCICASGHRGGGFTPMSAHGSADRVMSPRARTPGGKRGPGSRHGSAEQGNSPQAMETGSAAK